MAHIALYRKYRPKTFTDVVGQDQVSHTLMHAIKADKVAHAYLFAGPRGTGKTSMAKIFARAINCEQGPTDHPCNECTACRQILLGQSMDVFEIDAASNRGIDEIRSLRESVKFLPVEGRKKIFIIDEAHMLTNEAWSALLKTIEEPPDHVMFIFATTEQEKLPVTILSRCQRYTFSRITAEHITQRLLYVADQEGILLQESAARLIAVHADGGLRDALSILDQCAGMVDGEITVDLVEDLVGLVGKDWVIGFIDDVRSGEGAHILGAIQEALSQGRDAQQILEAVVQHIRALIIGKVAPNSEELSIYESQREAFDRQCQELSLSELNQYIRDLQRIQNDAKNVDNPRIIIEMGLLVMCSQALAEDEKLETRLARLEQQERGQQEGILNRLAQLEAAPKPLDFSSSGIGLVPSPSIEGNSVGGQDVAESLPRTRKRPPVSKSTRSSASVGRASGVPVGASPLPPPAGQLARPPLGANGQVSDSAPLALTNVLQVPTSSNRPSSDSMVQGLVEASKYKTLLSSVVKYLRENNRAMIATTLSMSQLIFADASRVVICVKSQFYYSMLTNSEHNQDVAKAFSAFLGYPLAVEAVTIGSEEDKHYRHLAQGGTSQKGDNHPVSQPSQEKPIETYKWDPDHMTEEEKANPIIAETLSKMAEDHDIYVEVLEDSSADNK